MHCPNCGSELENDAKFCTSCGKAIPAGAAPAPEAPAEPVAPAAPVDDGPKTDSRQSYSQTANNGGGVLPFDQFFKTLITAVAKPVTGVIEEKERYTSFANSAILSAIVILILTVIRSVVLCITGYIINPWVDAVYFLLTPILSFIMFAILTFGLAGVYYIAGAILKESWNYSKILSITAMSVGVGYIIRCFIAPFCGLLYSNLEYGISMAGLVYMMLMLYEGVNDETKLTGNKRVFVHAACLGFTFLVSFLF